MAKETELPGMIGRGVERLQIKAVDNAVVRYVSARDARMELTKKEVEEKAALIDVLRKHVDKIGADADGTIVYRHDDLFVTLRHGKDELKVKTTSTEDENGDDE